MRAWSNSSNVITGRQRVWRQVEGKIEDLDVQLPSRYRIMKLERRHLRNSWRKLHGRSYRPATPRLPAYLPFEDT